MNESITRAAGSGHGQEWTPGDIESLVRTLGREPWMRTTLYDEAPAERRQAAFSARPVTAVSNAPAGKRQRSKQVEAAHGEVDSVRLLFPLVPHDPHAELYERVVLMAACN